MWEGRVSNILRGNLLGPKVRHWRREEEGDCLLEPSVLGLGVLWKYLLWKLGCSQQVLYRHIVPHLNFHFNMISSVFPTNLPWIFLSNQPLQNNDKGPKGTGSSSSLPQGIQYSGSHWSCTFEIGGIFLKYYLWDQAYTSSVWEDGSLCSLPLTTSDIGIDGSLGPLSGKALRLKAMLREAWWRWDRWAKAGMVHTWVRPAQGRQGQSHLWDLRIRHPCQIREP